MVIVTQFMRKPRSSNYSIERLYHDVRAVLPEDCQAEVWTCQEFSNGLLPRLRDMWRARRHQGDVNHVTGDVHYLTFLLDRRRTILTIHDLVLLDRMHGIKRWLVWFFWYWLPVKRSRMIITISQATRAALLKSVNCKPDKVRVIHNPVSKEFQPSDYTFNTSCPRILQVGSGPNKNIEGVAAALEGISAHLVIIGSLTSDQTAHLRHYRISFENHVGLSREELLAQYKKADMLVFASTYEGFGLPIIEAQATGRPVVTSNIAPMSEVAGCGACLVDPFDVMSLRGGILKVIDDNEYRSDLTDYGFHNVKRFNAEEVSRRYAEIYRDLSMLSDD